MCTKFKWMITFGSISGLVQSILWMGLGLVGALVYLCVIPVRPYKTDSDFFRVTFVKLYFEGPKCVPDGSYLGQFNEEYKTVIDIFTHDRVFTVMIAYVILNAIYFILSIMFYIRRNRPSKRGVALGWSSITLLLCVLDAAFCCGMIFDYIRLCDLKLLDELQLSNVRHVPLTMALLSSRFVIVWLCNFIIGAIIFLDALCCRNIIKKPKPPKHPERTDAQVEEVKPPVGEPEKPKPDMSVINGYYRNMPKYRLSMEATTRFNVPETPVPIAETGEWEWGYPVKEAQGHPEPRPGREWKMINEGYVSDEEEKRPDFDHDLKNFESGQRKIKIVKPPLGKPVSIPVPPPLPPNSSCNC